MAEVVCIRCRRVAVQAEDRFLVDGWTGTVSEAVCPGCGLVEWHPHCTSLVDVDGHRVDTTIIPRDEWSANLVIRCEHIDLTVSWIDQADWPTSWSCARCGGTEFEGVTRDYIQSGLTEENFKGHVDVEGDDG